MAIIIMFLQSFKPEATLCLPVTATNMQHKQVFKNDPYQLNFFKQIADTDLKDLVEAASFMDI